MKKTIRELATEIVADQGSVFANDAGQGSGGPSIIDPGTLAELVESGEIDDYELVDGREAAEIVDATIAALAPRRYELAVGTRWIVAGRTDEGDCNPYRHYLLLWDMEPVRYEIDEASMGSEWRGDLDSFTEVLQDVAGDDWEIVAITDSYNGAKNKDAVGNRIDIPEDVWLRALDTHAKLHPDMWRCG